MALDTLVCEGIEREREGERGGERERERVLERGKNRIYQMYASCKANNRAREEIGSCREICVRTKDSAYYSQVSAGYFVLDNAPNGVSVKSTSPTAQGSCMQIHLNMAWK